MLLREAVPARVPKSRAKGGLDRPASGSSLLIGEAVLVRDRESKRTFLTATQQGRVVLIES